MNISVDGGALCTGPSRRYGTYHFTSNFITSLSEYDSENSYRVYTFCSTPATGTSTGKNVILKPLRPSAGWMYFRVPLEEYLRKNTIFLAFNQAIPLITPSRIFAWSHGTAYLYRPNLYPDSQSRLKGQLLNMGRRAERIFVTSQKVKDDIGQYVKGTPVHVLPIGVPYDMYQSKALLRKPFFLFTGMNHPVKNIQFIIDSFIKFVSGKEFSSFQLLLATGSPDGLNIHHDNIRIIHPDRSELRNLYRTAAGLLSASLYESFNLPVLEALSQGCPVIALESAVIPELRPFVTAVNSSDDFIESMKLAANRKLPAVPVPEIRKRFHWKHIAESVISYY